jgi:gluconolactonase
MSQHHEVRAPGFHDVVGDAPLEKLSGGFGFLEGPVWYAKEGSLVFSDIANGRMHRRLASGEIKVFREPSHMANGNTLDREGRLLTCEHATSRVCRLEPDGRLLVLASHYRGMELNSPNDIVVARSGAIYFTDPSYGRMEYYGVPREQQLDFQGVYRMAHDGSELTCLVDDFVQPNGLCFSADERRLFVNDTERGHIRVFDAGPSGDVVGGAVWAETTGEGEGGPDGMKLDSAGNVYCCGPGGVHIFDPSGTALGVVRIPEMVANFAFGDNDLRTLYITASSSLYRLRVKIPGLVFYEASQGAVS